ncbi:MAG: ORF6N domain-containing protein [Desulfovibrionales bacterium]
MAKLYGVTTKALKQAVRRNIDRFPEDFMFELSEDEWKILRSQTVTSSWGGTRYAPMAFTEQGVAMLSSVLRSERAIQVNIQIMRTFTMLRGMLVEVEELKRKVESMEENVDERFQIVFEAIQQLMSMVFRGPASVPIPAAVPRRSTCRVLHACRRGSRPLSSAVRCMLP